MIGFVICSGNVGEWDEAGYSVGERNGGERRNDRDNKKGREKEN